MAELIAQGTTFENRWRRRLPPSGSLVLGRGQVDLATPWDHQISRQHATLTPQEQCLKVEKKPTAGNPIFYRGNEAIEFTLEPGEHFVIGTTTFTFSVSKALATVDVPNPISQKTFSHQFLRQLHYRDADRRINVINRLPDVIASAANEEDLLTRMGNTLLAGIPSATTIGIVELNNGNASDRGSADKFEVIHWDRRSLGGGDFEASEKLIQQAITTGETVLHFWDKSQTPDENEYTFDLSNDWAFACPIDSIDRLEPVGREQAFTETLSIPETDRRNSSWAIYVTGRNRRSVEPFLAPGMPPQGSGEADLEGDIKFCELIAATLKNLLQLRQLERRQSSLRRFFSPAVLRAFSTKDPEEVLVPRQCTVSVLFCDLRGFSKTSEAMADNLLQLLDQVSDSLGVMTSVILDQGGVIGDFHGDAAMGFWGWPLKLDDGASKAVCSAIEIQNQLMLTKESAAHELFEMGIGIGTGQAVAGRIGTDDQVKVTAFGPVVNLASRLEGMTQVLGCPILIDEATAIAVKNADTKIMPVPLGTFLPYGMRKPVKVFRLAELVNQPGAEEQRLQLPKGAITRSQLSQLTAAVEAFTQCDWESARKMLADLPPTDPGVRIINQYMASPAHCENDFDGVIQINRK